MTVVETRLQGPRIRTCTLGPKWELLLPSRTVPYTARTIEPVLHSVIDVGRSRGPSNTNTLYDDDVI